MPQCRECRKRNANKANGALSHKLKTDPDFHAKHYAEKKAKQQRHNGQNPEQAEKLAAKKRGRGSVRAKERWASDPEHRAQRAAKHHAWRQGKKVHLAKYMREYQARKRAAA